MRVRVAPSDAVAGGAAAAPQQASRGKPLRVHVATWNLGEATPPAQLGALLAEDADGACAHAYLCQATACSASRRCNPDILGLIGMGRVLQPRARFPSAGACNFGVALAD